jgi:ABC-2 type transport system ATP-binding protein
MLTLRNFSKSYSGHHVLEIKELTFKQGLSWIKGENGSGKTTLFKSIAGILPFDGDILFPDGISQKNDPVAFRRRVNFSEAEPQYPGFLTAKDLVRFAGKIKNASSEQQEKYCRSLGVDTFFDKPAETYSSGMMKKLDLTLAFLGEPQFIILDEPMITLDEQARAVLFELIREKMADQITFLISSHHSIATEGLDIATTFQLENKTLRAL